MRLLKTIAGSAGLALLAVQPAFAQSYPAKPIKLVVPWPAGGIVDVLGRVVAEKLQASFGQPVVTAGLNPTHCLERTRYGNHPRVR